MKKKSALSAPLSYAGSRGKPTYLSPALSALSSVPALTPFVCLWRIIREALEVRPDFSQATGIVRNGWMAELIAKEGGVLRRMAQLQAAGADWSI